MSRRAPVVTALALALSAVALAGCERKADQQPNQAIKTTGTAAIGGSFRLVDQNGRAATERDLIGKPSLVFFGFTYCPEVCPTTLLHMTRWFKELGADGDKLNAFYVTVDPQRDTSKKLKQYLSAFDPRTPTATFETCPRDLDVLLTGGGLDGTLAAMRDPATVAFLADRGARAKWVTSVCTGSLLLGQAGLLRGYRATSHWLGRPLLKDFGAIEVDERVVFDRNRATGAGVSAGLDLGLSLVQRLRPLDLAQAMQLVAEYAPEPPLDSGTPSRAPAAVVAGVRDRTAGFVDAVRETARSARS